jgi:hypothetical protein
MHKLIPAGFCTRPGDGFGSPKGSPLVPVFWDGAGAARRLDRTWIGILQVFGEAPHCR